MLYSILNSHYRFSLGNEIENSYIDWSIDRSINLEFDKYKESYVIKNDISIFDVSYFDFLCEFFYCNRFSLQYFDFSLLIKEFQNKIFKTRLSYYQIQYPSKETIELNNLCITDELRQDKENILPNLGKNLEYFKLQDSASFVKPQEILEENKVSSEDLTSIWETLAAKDSENLESYKSQILESNPIILNEFKEFIMGFHDYIIQLVPKQYSQFKTYLHILREDMCFFKNTQIHSLSKYKFNIGISAESYSDVRKKINAFIPAGSCHYGKHIFINSVGTSQKYGVVWFRLKAKRLLYHEIGHALDYLYFNDVVLKNSMKQERSSHNDEFKGICIKNYSKFRILKSSLLKNHSNFLSYYVMPLIEKKKQRIETETIDNFSEKLNEDYQHIFSDMIPLNQIIDKDPALIKFSSKIHRGKEILDFSRPLSESWAESFSFVFSWIKNGFCEYDKFAIESGYSRDRALIKIQHDCMIYILENFDWAKLNISYAAYLKRKVQIKKYLKHIKEMPLIMKKKSHRKSKSKIYLTYVDLIKNGV